MILPTTYTSALLLLAVSFVCFGVWINTFKLAGPRWRFELYSIDFAVGVLLISVLSAFTLGTLGSDLAFSDRLLVAGRASQAFVFAGGFLFNLGNMLLLAAVSLLGISAVFPVAVGLALIISSLFWFRGANALFLASGLVLMIVTLLVNIAASRMRDAAQRRVSSSAKPSVGVGTSTTASAGTTNVASKTGLRNPPKPPQRKTGKGIFISLLSGAMLGFFYPIAAKGMTGELSLGPYAGILVFSLGMVISTVLFDFYFLNIAIEGERLSSAAYFQGKARQHFLGIAGGALWGIGALAVLLAAAVPTQASVHGMLNLVAPVGSVVLAVCCGVFAWREFKAAPANAKLSLYVASALFAGSLVLIAVGVTS